MPLTINSNSSATTTLRRLEEDTQLLKRNFERLSSGLRIVHAADDAAGLAISSSLKADARILQQGQRNGNDTLSMFRIAEGATQQLGNILIRIEELAEQSANGVITTKQRKALDAEARALRNEYNRIIQTTTFNSLTLLDGGISGLETSLGGSTVRLGFDQVNTVIAGDSTFKIGQSFGTGINDSGNLQNLVDINNDGILDLVESHNGSSAQTFVYMGNGDGTFKSGVVSVMNVMSDQKFEDLNHDGFLDSVYTHPNIAAVFLGNGNGTFKFGQYLITGANSLREAAIGDVNNDSIQDLVFAQNGPNEVTTLLGNSDGSFRAGIVFNTGAPIPFQVSIADMNGDDLDDVITGDIGGPLVWLSNGNGTYKAPISWTASGGDSRSHNIIGDADGDGKYDIISASQYNGIVSIRYGAGDGNMAGTAVTYDLGTVAVLAGAKDYNDDGVLDIFANVDGTGRIMLGNKDRSYKLSTNIAPPSKTIGSVGDVNGDGILDITTHEQFTAATVLLSNGNYKPELGSVSLLTQEDALDTLTRAKKYLERLTASVGVLGAAQSRVETALSVLGVSVENYQAAASQIMDVDVAEESAQLVKHQIRQQAAAAVLSQAVLQPQLVLTLLRF